MFPTSSDCHAWQEYKALENVAILVGEELVQVQLLPYMHGRYETTAHDCYNIYIILLQVLLDLWVHSLKILDSPTPA
jgi:hypothetical protein